MAPGSDGGIQREIETDKMGYRQRFKLSIARIRKYLDERWEDLKEM